MIRGGMPTVFVTDMSRAVKFYTGALGLALKERWGDHFAAVDAGDGLLLGLHPASPNAPPPGTSGSIQIGLNVAEPLDDVVSRLRARGVKFRGPIAEDPNGGVRIAFLGDPDGNDLYLCEVVRSG
jgi:predicted enzyme related to lactoylglutathione lyase